MFRLVCVSIIKFRLVCVERLDCLHDCDIYICAWYVRTRIIDFCFAEDFHCITAIHFNFISIKKSKEIVVSRCKDWTGEIQKVGELWDVKQHDANIQTHIHAGCKNWTGEIQRSGELEDIK